MPEYVFTGPDGSKYYASGDDPDSAFPQARPIAQKDIDALVSQRRPATAGMEREMERGAEIGRESERYHRENDPTVANELAAMAVPGYGPLMSAAQGRYSEAAGEAALTAALPLARAIPARAALPLAAAAGGIAGLGGGATAADQFDFIPDKEERAAAQAEFNKIQGYVKDERGRNVKDKAETQRLQSEFMRDLRKEAGRKAEQEGERRRTEKSDKEALDSFYERNKKTIDSLSEDQKTQLENRRVPGNVRASITNMQDYLSKVGTEREAHGKTWVESHYHELEWVRGIAALTGVAIPTVARIRRIAALEEATAEATAAFKAYTKGKPTPAETAEFDRTMATLRESVERGRGVEGAKEVGKELAYGSLLPYGAATFVPNALEAGGRFNEGTPEGREMGWRAVGNMVDPVQFGTGAGEGVLLTAGGQYIGGAVKNAARAIPRGAGQLASMEGLKAREAQTAADKAAKLAQTRSDKLARSESTIAERERIAYERGRSEVTAERAADVEKVSLADDLKYNFAKTFGDRMKPTEENAEALVKALKASKRPKRDVLKAGGPLAPPDDVLAPGPQLPMGKAQ